MPDDPIPPDATAEPPDPDDGPEDADLIAYLDGELDGPEARAVEAEIALDPATRARAEAYKRVDGLLDFLPKPEPAQDFTTRTLTRLRPLVGAGSSPAAPVAGSTPTTTLPGGSVQVTAGMSPLPATWSVWLLVLGWATAAVVAAVGGYCAHAALRPVAPADDLTIADLRVIENLPLYLGVDDLDSLQTLAGTGLFEPDLPSADAAPRAGGPRPEQSPDARDRMIAMFRAYPPARRQQLRQLDQALHDLPPADRDRLTGVLEEYAVWLDRLPDPDRREVLGAPGPGERLDVVRRVWAKAWRDALPARAREQLRQTADAQERLQLVEAWKAAELARRDEWQLARRQWEVVRDKGGRPPWPFHDPALAAAVDEYVRTVLRADLSVRPEKGSFPPSTRLSLPEYLELKDRHDAALKEGHWFLYGAMLHRLAQRHPSLPAPGRGPPVTEAQQLPKEVREAVRPKQLLTALDRRAARGKWPEFAREVADALKKAGHQVPDGLGPARPGEFAPEVNEVLARDLDPRLSAAERAELTKLEGKWPAYPDRVMELARAHDLPIPGVTLPGPPSRWARFYSLTPPRRE